MCLCYTLNVIEQFVLSRKCPPASSAGHLLGLVWGRRMMIRRGLSSRMSSNTGPIISDSIPPPLHHQSHIGFYKAELEQWSKDLKH